MFLRLRAPKRLDSGHATSDLSFLSRGAGERRGLDKDVHLLAGEGLLERVRHGGEKEKANGPTVSLWLLGSSSTQGRMDALGGIAERPWA